MILGRLLPFCVLLTALQFVPAQPQYCATNPCMNGGTCMASPSMTDYFCACPMEYTGQNCTDPVLGICMPNPCLNNGTCMPSPGMTYRCTCPIGYSGMNCENDACRPNPCHNNGTCNRDTSGNMFDCRCPVGFSGGTCQTDACQPNPCRNGGTCIRDTSGNMYECTCPVGFSGGECQTDACQSNPCRNGGTCIRDTSGNMYECICPTGFSGGECQNQGQDPCVPNPCQNGGVCMPQLGGMHNCTCQNGATGNNCQNLPQSTNITTIIIVVVVVVVVLIVVLIVVVVCIVRKARPRRSGDESSTAEKGRGQELTEKKKTNDYVKRPGARSKEFPRDKLHIFGQLGSGSFAVVYKAEAEGIVRKGTNTTVAVKMLKETATPNDQSDFQKELQLYSMLDRHPNVLSMLGCCTDKDPMYIILEYVPHGNLQTYLRQIRTGADPTYLNKNELVRKNNLTPTEILTFACQVVRGMEYLESKQCIHRDLATRNILLGEGMICKVADFGLARDVAERSQYEMQSQGRVPVRWMAPESLLTNMYTCKSDVWSFGVLLWELVTLGSHPYPGMSSQKVINEIKKGYRLPKPDHCSDDVYKIMQDCWQERPDDRPDFARLHITIDDILADAAGYLEMGNLNQDDYVYLEPGQDASSTESA